MPRKNSMRARAGPRSQRFGLPAIRPRITATTMARPPPSSVNEIVVSKPSIKRSEKLLSASKFARCSSSAFMCQGSPGEERGVPLAEAPSPVLAQLPQSEVSPVPLPRSVVEVLLVERFDVALTDLVSGHLKWWNLGLGEPEGLDDLEELAAFLDLREVLVVLIEHLLVGVRREYSRAGADLVDECLGDLDVPQVLRHGVQRDRGQGEDVGPSTLDEVHAVLSAAHAFVVDAETIGEPGLDARG